MAFNIVHKVGSLIHREIRRGGGTYGLSLRVERHDIVIKVCVNRTV